MEKKEKEDEIFIRLDEMKEKIDILSSKINLLADNINLLNSNLEKLHKTTGRMDEHISFVEGTYQTLRYPLDVLKDSVERIFPNRAIQD